MSAAEPIRWGIIGTGNIARAAFLPGLRAAGGGVAEVVASRDEEKGRSWAAQHGVNRAVGGYDTLLADDTLDAIYIPLPNNLHAEWTIAALQSGKAVLCEKPLCTSVEETERVLETARSTGSLLWEAFVFPFHRQFERLQALAFNGDIGEVREIQSNFYFKLRNRHNIRLLPEMCGGALNDVGCYCLRLAELVFDADLQGATGMAVWGSEGVDDEMSGIGDFGEDRRLTFSCGMFRAYDTFTRVIGTEGEIRLTNPFHPGATDTLELHQPGTVTTEHPTGTEPSFTRAIQHIHAVLRGEEEPRHLATEDSLRGARSLAMVHEAIGAP